MYKKSLAWVLVVAMTISLFMVAPIKAEAETVVKNICDADVLADGDIAIVYISEGNVYYGELDPSTNNWSKQEIASGKDAALALDGSGRPHIAYIKTNDDLGYTYYNGSSWSTVQTIDSVNFGGVEGVLYSPDIAIDTSGYAHIAYMDTKAGYSGGNDYLNYDVDDLMYATNAGGTGVFAKAVRSYSHGWYYSPDGWRNQVKGPCKITYANGRYSIGVKQYSYDKDMWGQYHTYSYDLFYPIANVPNSDGYYIRSASTNYDLGFKLYEMDTDGTNVFSLFNKSGTLYIANGVGEIDGATKVFTSVAADLFVNGSSKYYAAINSSSLLLYQNGTFKEGLTLPTAISSTNYRTATVVSGSKQYVLYTDTSGDLLVCGISTEASSTDISTYKIPDKAAVTISGVSVTSKAYNGTSINYTGTPSATVSETSQAASISSYDYTWYDVTNSATLTQAPKTVGSYKLIVSVPESNSTYTGSSEILFTITKKTITIAGIEATDRSYNGLTNVSITGGNLVGIVGEDDVSANVPSTGSMTDANTGNDKAVNIANVTLSGADSSNYSLTQPTGLKVNISKANLTINTVTVSSKIYDGSTNASVSNVTFNGLQNSETLASVTDFTVSAAFDNANAGTGKTVSGIVALSSTEKAKNYNLTSGVYTASGSITKASGLSALNPANIKVYKSMVRGYSYDLSSIGLNKSDVGSVTYGLGTLTGGELFSVNPTIAADGKTLTYTSASVSTGSATQVITISTQNYQDTTATLTFVLADKELVTITGVSVTSKIYDGSAMTYTGTPSAVVTESGDPVAITSYAYTWYDVTNSTALTQAPKNVGSYKLIVFISDSTSIYTGTLEIPFSINKKDLTIKPMDKNININDELPSLEIKYVGLVDGEVGSDVVTFSEDLVMEVQDDEGHKLVDTSKKGNYSIVFTNSPTITAENYNITTDDGVLKIEKPAVRMNYTSEDEGSGIKVGGLEGNITISEKNEDDVEAVTLSIKAMNATKDKDYDEIFKASEDTLKEKGYILLNAFDLSIVKAIKNTDGTVSEVKVSNDDISGLITVLLPIPEDFDWEGEIGIAYIDDQGNVEKIPSNKVTINGKDYLEFKTDHFSIYAIVKIEDTETQILPKTGESNPTGYYVVGMLILGMGIYLLKKKKASINK